MRRFLFPILLGLVGASVLASLGVWQLQRLAWKEGILAEVDARLAEPPGAIPARPDAEADRFLPVRVSGTTGERELHVLTSVKGLGPGFRVITAFQTVSRRRVLLDRGFIPDAAKGEIRPPLTAVVTGNLHWPDERDLFTPANDPEGNYWYARDVALMADVLGTEPVLIVAETTQPEDPLVTPLPLDTSGIPNNHLGYAIQWFGLALVWLGMSGFWLWRLARRL